MTIDFFFFCFSSFRYSLGNYFPEPQIEHCRHTSLNIFHIFFPFYSLSVCRAFVCRHKRYHITHTRIEFLCLAYDDLIITSSVVVLCYCFFFLGFFPSSLFSFIFGYFLLFSFARIGIFGTHIRRHLTTSLTKNIHTALTVFVSSFAALPKTKFKKRYKQQGKTETTNTNERTNERERKIIAED